MLLGPLGLSSCAAPASNKVLSDATAGAEPVKLKGARGDLTVAQSRAVLDRIKAKSPDTNIFDLHLAIEESVAGSPLTLGNKAVLLQDGPRTFAAMFAAIEGAKDHVFVEMYIVEDDETGQRFADAFIKKQQQGVPVSVLYDSVGSIGTPKPFFQRLRDNGVTVAEFNPVNPLNAKVAWGLNLNERDHRKLVIVDGRVAFLGGINISGVYSGGSAKGGPSKRSDRNDTRPWRDTQVQLEGPVVPELQKSFVEAWSKAAKDPPPSKQKLPAAKPAGNEAVRVLAGWADDKEEVSPIYVTFLSAIASAQTSIHIAMAYFVPDPTSMKALQDAAKRGVDVKLILPSFTDFWAVFHAGRSKYGDLLESGVKIYERKERLLHSKTAVIDGVWSTVGSANIDWRSFAHNHELNAVILGPEFGTQMEAAFEKDLASSEAITPEKWRQRPINDRVRELAARVWEYWL